MSPNIKSDVDAKAAFVSHLLRTGFERAHVTGSPADITALKDGATYYFEIKFTRQGERYFGAATLTEWEAALANEEQFKFVVALIRNGEWEFHQYTPSEFMAFSYIPPFKVFFNVGVQGAKDTSQRRGSRSVRLTRERVQRMSALYSLLKNGS